MKKILFLLLPNLAFAQSYIAPSITFAKTSIYNKEDVKHWLLPSTTSYTTGFSLKYGKVGKRLNYEIGIGYNPIIQKYKGFYSLNNPAEIATAIKKLNYLQVPILISKSFNNDKKFSPFIQAGLCINYLLSYTMKFNADIASFGVGQPINAFVIYNQTGNEIEMSNNSVTFQNKEYAIYKSSEWYFKKFVFGTNFNIGFDYKLNSNFSLRLISDNYISITNPENNSKMDLSRIEGNGDPLYLGLTKNFNPYELYSGIVYRRPGLPPRKKSLLISNGISISIKYFLNNKNK